MQKILIKSFHGLEDVVAEDARAFGAQEVAIGRRSVSALGDLQTIYRLNYESRTALSVLVEIKTGKLRDESSLYKLVQEIQWYEHFDVSKTFRIDAVCFGDLFTNSLYVAQLCKDAIVDQFRARLGRRPNVSRDPNVRINVFINQQKCIISMDTSGASLFKRGYRFHTGEAPLNEVLASGMIRLTGWQGQTP
ncbi:MAG: RNA methyltransferase, partial [Saprospiraceae bacterium]|nr:RNA methyltransferase [Saprospiraceae bacterium]